MLIFGLLSCQEILAQTDSTDPQVICVGTIRPYRVDYTENAGAGTTGSTYTWAILTPGFLGTISTNQGPGASSNAISINWGATPEGPYVLQVIETNGGCPGTPIQLNILLTPLITPEFNAIGPLCQNSIPPTLPTSSTNSPAITGSWDALINTTAVGTVVYTFTPDAGQCALTTTLSVTITNQITPMFAVIGPLCQNSTAPVLPTSSTNIPAITGTWDAAISTSTPGTVIYNFTPAAGQCAINATLSVTVNPTPTISITSGPTCSVDLLTWSVNVTVSAGTLTSSVGNVLNTSGNAWTISAIPAGQAVTLTVTNLGCPGTLAINAPNCNCPTVDAPIGTDAAYCIGSSPVPALTATVLAGQTLNWYDAPSGGNLIGTGSPFVPSGPGNYYAEAFDNVTSCVSSTRDVVTLTENVLPTINALGDATLCQSESTTLSASGAVSYSWSPSTGLSATSGTPVTATPPVGTIIYTVTGTDANTCQNTDTVTVIVNATPTTSAIFHD